MVAQPTCRMMGRSSASSRKNKNHNTAHMNQSIASQVAATFPCASRRAWIPVGTAVTATKKQNQPNARSPIAHADEAAGREG